MNKFSPVYASDKISFLENYFWNFSVFDHRFYPTSQSSTDNLLKHLSTQSVIEIILYKLPNELRIFPLTIAPNSRAPSSHSSKPGISFILSYQLLTFLHGVMLNPKCWSKDETKTLISKWNLREWNLTINVDSEAR